MTMKEYTDISRFLELEPHLLVGSYLYASQLVLNPTSIIGVISKLLLQIITTALNLILIGYHTICDNIKNNW